MTYTYTLTGMASGGFDIRDDNNRIIARADDAENARLIVEALNGPLQAAESPYATELRQRHQRIADGLATFRIVYPVPNVDPIDLHKADDTLTAVRDHVWDMYMAEVAR